VTEIRADRRVAVEDRVAHRGSIVNQLERKEGEKETFTHKRQQAESELGGGENRPFHQRRRTKGGAKNQIKTKLRRKEGLHSSGRNG